MFHGSLWTRGHEGIYAVYVFRPGNPAFRSSSPWRIRKNGGMQSVEIHLTRADWRHLAGPHGWSVRVLGWPDDEAALLAAFGANGADALAIDQLPGHFSAIAVQGQRTVLVQDAVRSFPLFYTRAAGGRWQVSDSIFSARTRSATDQVSDEASLEFLHSGYVTGRDTLHTGIFQVQAGEILSFASDGADPQSVIYRSIDYTGENVRDEQEVDARFSAALDVSMGRFLARADGRQLVIPLSGGLDSRLLSLYLKDVGYDNVLNFTYGTGPTREVGISRTVAEAVGQPWHFLEYEPERLRREWAGEGAAEFIRDSYAGASLPHIQDWLAVQDLRDRALISEDAVFLPGHTIVGNMHDEWMLADPTPMPREAFLETLFSHHYRIRPDAKRIRGHQPLLAKMHAFLDEMGYTGSQLDRLRSAENWNVRERQTKYINNSMRGYEHFGYEWALPMLDREVYTVWGSFDPSITQDRDWYHRYVARRYRATTGTDIGTFVPNNVSAAKRSAAKRALKAVGLLGVAERTITARAVSQHPMGFNWFTGDLTQSQLRREIMRGGTPMGVWTEQFLADRWNRETRLFS